MNSSSRTSTVAERFYAWEQRARGEDRYDTPVELEPPFRYMAAPRRAADRDDTRRRTWLAHLFQGRSPAPEPQGEPGDEPLPRAFSWRAPLVERIALVPEDADLPPGLSRAWVETLAALGGPVSYELVGHGGRAEIRLACAATDEALLRQSFEGAVPGALLSDDIRPLAHLWSEAPGESILVEFCLARASVLPLAWDLHKVLDPLGPLAAALSSVPNGIGVLQVLFEPASAPWAEATTGAVRTPGGDPLFAAAPDLTRLADEKVASPLFAAALRLGLCSKDERAAQGVLRAVAGTLARLGAPDRNELMPLVPQDAGEDSDLELDLLLRTTHRSGMLLSSRELGEIVRLPTSRAPVPALVRRAPIALPEALRRASPGAIRLGQGERGGEIWLPEAERLRHVHVIGASGSGKSTLLVDMIAQDMEAGRGLAVLDVHGDLADAVMARVPEHRIEDVVVFDPSDPVSVVGWNVLHAETEAERQVLASDLVAVFRRLSTSWGDQMTSVLANAVLAMLSLPGGGTLVELRRFLVDKAFRASCVDALEDEHLAAYWRTEYGLIASRHPEAPILTRLDALLRSPLVRGAVSARSRPLDFRGLLERRGILLARLSQGAIGAENAALLGSLLVTKIQQAALARQDTAEQHRAPFYLYMDEFHEIATPSMATLFSGVRKYGVGLVVAHQDLYQLHGAVPEVERAVLANASTRVCFRVGGEDARKLASGFRGFSEDDLTALATGEAVCRIGTSSHAATLRTRPLLTSDEGALDWRREAVIASSRERYGVPRGAMGSNEEGKAQQQSLPASGGSRQHEGQTGAAAEAAAAQSQGKQSSSHARRQIRRVPKAPRADSEGSAVDSVAARSSKSDMSSTQETPPPPSPQTPAAPSQGGSASPSKPGRFDELVRTRPAHQEGGSKDAARGAVSEDTPARSASSVSARRLGRGGQRHRALQETVQREAVAKGWRAAVEHTLPAGGGAVDVSLERGDVRVACEISVTSTPEHELASVRKNLAAGYSLVVVLSESEKGLQKLERCIAAALPLAQRDRVRFGHPDALFKSILADLPAPSENTQVVGAYRVRVKRSAESGAEDAARRRALSDVLAQSMHRLGGADMPS